MKKINLHTHVQRCKHATGDVSDYCLAARNSGVSILGFSDHNPFPGDNCFFDTRMSFGELTDYRCSIENAVAQFPDLDILAGLEIDYFPSFGLDYYRETLFRKQRLDYLIGGVHYVYNDQGKLLWRQCGDDTREMIACYVRQEIELIETGLLDYLTHPDLIARSISEWTPWVDSAFEEIVLAAVAHHLPMEINAYGVRKGLIETPSGKRWGYPIRDFWKLAAKHGARVVIGSDTHSPESMADGWDECQKILDEFGLVPCNDEVARMIMNRKSKVL